MNFPSLFLRPFKYTASLGTELTIIGRRPVNTLCQLVQKIACLVALSFFLLLTFVFELLLIPIGLARRCCERISSSLPTTRRITWTFRVGLPAASRGPSSAAPAAYAIPIPAAAGPPSLAPALPAAEPPGRVPTAEEINQAKTICFRVTPRLQFILQPKGVEVDGEEYLKQAVDAAFEFLPPEKVAYIKQFLAEGGMGGEFDVYRWIGACTVLRYVLTRYPPKDFCPNYLEQFRATPYQESPNGVVRPSLTTLGKRIDNLNLRAWASLIFQTYDIQTKWQMGPMTKSFYEHIQLYGQVLSRDPDFLASVARVFPLEQ